MSTHDVACVVYNPNASPGAPTDETTPETAERSDGRHVRIPDSAEEAQAHAGSSSATNSSLLASLENALLGGEGMPASTRSFVRPVRMQLESAFNSVAGAGELVETSSRASHPGWQRGGPPSQWTNLFAAAPLPDGIGNGVLRSGEANRSFQGSLLAPSNDFASRPQFSFAASSAAAPLLDGTSAGVLESGRVPFAASVVPSGNGLLPWNQPAPSLGSVLNVGVQHDEWISIRKSEYERLNLSCVQAEQLVNVTETLEKKLHDVREFYEQKIMDLSRTFEAERYSAENQIQVLRHDAQVIAANARELLDRKDAQLYEVEEACRRTLAEGDENLRRTLVEVQTLKESQSLTQRACSAKDQLLHRVNDEYERLSETQHTFVRVR